MTRTRFAPSPTGYLHIGGLRTALYNYLYAKKNKGDFLLRIEDTDQKRYIEGATEHLIDTLTRFGLNHDEGPKTGGPHAPYIQSKRTDLYRKYAEELVKNKKAYHCFCTPKRLEEMRNKQVALKQAPMYDRTCLNLSEEEIASKIKAGEPFVIRQKIPHGQKIKFKDLVRGTVVFETSNIDDQVLIKSDNFPTYHLANVVDDHLMEISHVIRGEEWLPSTPKHILLYQALGWSTPQFAHIPLLLNKDKSKLSKRQGDVSVESYIKKGYLIEALINFIALLGWHPGKGEEQEIYTIEELIEKFDLSQVHKAGAIFDIEKLDWFNYKWNKNIHNKKLKNIAETIDSNVKIELNNRKEYIYTFQSQENTNIFNQERGKLLFEKYQKNINEDWIKNKDILLKALISLEDKLFKSPTEIEENLKPFFIFNAAGKNLLLNEKMKVDKQIALQALEESIKTIELINDFNNINTITTTILETIKSLGLKNGQLLWPLRVALTGTQYSPGAFEMLWTLGKEESIKRIKTTIEKNK